MATRWQHGATVETTQALYIKQSRQEPDMTEATELTKNRRKETKWKDRDFEFQLPLPLCGYIILNTAFNLPSFCTYKMELEVVAAPKAVIRVQGCTLGSPGEL